MMNLKGTLHVRQRKDHVLVKILDNSSYFRVCKAFTNRKVSLRFVKGLINYMYLRGCMGLLQSLSHNVTSSKIRVITRNVFTLLTLDLTCALESYICNSKYETR